jgi:hypothetical protein
VCLGTSSCSRPLCLLPWHIVSHLLVPHLLATPPLGSSSEAHPIILPSSIYSLGGSAGEGVGTSYIDQYEARNTAGTSGRAEDALESVLELNLDYVPMELYSQKQRWRLGARVRVWVVGGGGKGGGGEGSEQHLLANVT